MYLAQIKLGPDYIECPFDGERLEGLVSKGKGFHPSDDLLTLSKVYDNVSVIKCEGRIIFGAVSNENSNEVPISIEADGEVMSNSSRGRIKLKTISITDYEGNEREVIKINEDTLVIPEPDDDGDDDYGIFYFISRLD